MQYFYLSSLKIQCIEEKHPSWLIKLSFVPCKLKKKNILYLFQNHFFSILHDTILTFSARISLNSLKCLDFVPRCMLTTFDFSTNATISQKIPQRNNLLTKTLACALPSLSLFSSPLLALQHAKKQTPQTHAINLTSSSTSNNPFFIAPEQHQNILSLIN